MTTEPLFDVQPDWTRPTWTVRDSPVSGAAWALQYHYAHMVPAQSHFYGVYCPDMIATVAVGLTANPHGVAAKLGLTGWRGNLEITRVVCHPDAPKNTASRSVALVLPYVHTARGVDWVFSYADTGQNHHGGIYQALNAIYVGINGPARPGYLLNGKPSHPRTIVTTFGTQAWPHVATLAQRRGMTLERVMDAHTPKHVYVLPCGGPAVRRAIRAALADKTMPYPKRST